MKTKVELCNIVIKALYFQFYAEDFDPRTRETHRHHISTLNGPLYEYNSTTYGLRGDSLLNKSLYFHVTNGLVPDIMHDVLEGSLAYEIKELIRYANSEGFCRLGDLNEAMNMFSYGSADRRNKPSPFNASVLTSNDHGLRQSG